MKKIILTLLLVTTIFCYGCESREEKAAREAAEAAERAGRAYDNAVRNYERGKDLYEDYKSSRERLGY